MTETKNRIENIKQRLGYTVDNRDAYVWSLDAKFLLDLNSSLETKLKSALEYIKEDKCTCKGHQDKLSGEWDLDMCARCGLIKELESTT